MMNFIGILIIGLYLAFSAYFLYLFKQNDFDLKKTLQAIKNKFFKKCKICQMFKNTKKTTETIKIKTEEGEKEIEIVKGDMEDCDAPLGFPFDICFDPENMTEEDKELREKLAEILRQRKQYIIDGGKKKLIIPLEATQFLTKNLNPLVNEYGEIIIIPKEKSILEQLRHAVFTIKNLDIELTDEVEIELTKNLEILKKLELAHYEQLEKIQKTKRKSRAEKRKQKKESQSVQNIKDKKENEENSIQNSNTNNTSENNENVKTEKKLTEEKLNNTSENNENINIKEENTKAENIEKPKIEENEKENKNNEEKNENKNQHKISENNNKEPNENHIEKNNIKENNDLTEKTMVNIENEKNAVVHAQHIETKLTETTENKKTQDNNQASKNSKIKISFDINELAKTKKEKTEENKNENISQKAKLTSCENEDKNETKQNENDIKHNANNNDENENNINENIITTASQKAELISHENEIKNEIKTNKMLNQKKIDITTIQNFYKKVLEYKHLFEPPIFNEENLVKNLQILNDRIGLGLFFNNLAKTTPLIYTDNKESVFADWKNIYIAFAMLYGAEFKNVITALLKLSMQEKIKFNEALAYILSDYIDDHFTGESNFCSIIVENTINNKLFRAYGAFFLMKGFKLGLEQNQMDFFRSFPYNSPYVIKNISKGLNLFEKKYPVLVDKANQVLIK